MNEGGGQIRELRHLLVRHVCQLFAAVAHVDAPQPRDSIEYTVALRVGEKDTFARHDLTRHAGLEAAVLCEWMPKAVEIELREV